jgi:hypothetical protein
MENKAFLVLERLCVGGVYGALTGVYAVYSALVWRALKDSLATPRRGRLDIQMIPIYYI